MMTAAERPFPHMVMKLLLGPGTLKFSSADTSEHRLPFTRPSWSRWPSRCMSHPRTYFSFAPEVCVFCPPSPIFPWWLLATTSLSQICKFKAFCGFLFVLTFHTYVISYSASLSLTYFRPHDALKVRPCCCTWQDFLLWLSSIREMESLRCWSVSHPWAWAVGTTLQPGLPFPGSCISPPSPGLAGWGEQSHLYLPCLDPVVLSTLDVPSASATCQASGMGSRGPEGAAQARCPPPRGRDYFHLHAHQLHP